MQIRLCLATEQPFDRGAPVFREVSASLLDGAIQGVLVGQGMRAVDLKLSGKVCPISVSTKHLPFFYRAPLF